MSTLYHEDKDIKMVKEFIDEKDNYTEAMLVLQDMQQASLRNDNMKNMIIEQGKYKILNQ